MIRLFTTFYREPRRERLAEYVDCLNRNLSCTALTEVCVLVEGADDILPASGKLRVLRIPNRPLYSDFFKWISDTATPGDISVIANADIWFDDSVGVASRALGPRECFAMARWDESTLFDRNDSQDCWVFRGPVVGVKGDFPIGIPRCDNRFLYELQAAGYLVRNPAFSIRAHHVHKGKRIEYATSDLATCVAEPYRYLWPHNLWPLQKTFLHNALHPAERIGWKFDRRRIGGMLPFRAIGKLRRTTSRTSDGSSVRRGP